MNTISSNIQWQYTKVNRSMREARNHHRGAVIWMTGLSGAGKSTLAINLEMELFLRGYHTYVLDGDNIRHGLNGDLQFTPADREENIRRVGETAKLFVDAGTIVITAFISPYRKDRQRVRNLLDDDDFIEIYVECPLDICEQRDPKGLYQKARAGEIPNFTGISAPYEEPVNAEITIKTDQLSIETSVQYIIDQLNEYGVIDTSKLHVMNVKGNGDGKEVWRGNYVAGSDRSRVGSKE